MSVADAFAPVMAHYKNVVVHQTFGHLFPDKKEYKGVVRLSCEMYHSQNTIILCESESLPQSSPWWYDAVTKFAEGVDLEPGEVVDYRIQVDIIECTEELDAEDIEDEVEAKEWSEIRIVGLERLKTIQGF